MGGKVINELDFDLTNFVTSKYSILPYFICAYIQQLEPLYIRKHFRGVRFWTMVNLSAHKVLGVILI